MKNTFATRLSILTLVAYAIFFLLSPKEEQIRQLTYAITAVHVIAPTFFAAIAGFSIACIIGFLSYSRATFQSYAKLFVILGILMGALINIGLIANGWLQLSFDTAEYLTSSITREKQKETIWWNSNGDFYSIK